MALIHTTELTHILSYKQLVRSGLIPDLLSVTPEIPAVKFPTWAKKKVSEDISGESVFGMTIEYILRRMLVDELKTARIDLGRDRESSGYQAAFYDLSRKWSDIIYECHLTATNGVCIYEKSTLNDYLPSLNVICSSIVSQFAQNLHLFGSELEYNTEYRLENIYGHPDIVSSNAVFDIKTTQNFRAYKDTSKCESWLLQILIYCALRRANGMDTQYACLVLPMQKMILIYNLVNWESTGLIELLINSGKQHFTNKFKNIMSVPANIESKIGHHVTKSKEKSIVIPVRRAIEHYGNRPVQIFCSGQQRSKMNPWTPAEIQEIRELVNNFKLPLFIHAPYSINLCGTPSSRGDDDFWALQYLKQDLTIGQAIGARGVVVHVGCHVNRFSPDVALDRMAESVKKVLPYATQQCPLLIETPAGEGTELLTKIEELAGFYALRFNDEERKRLKICVDSCHVWSASYDPLEYIQRWVQVYGAASVPLVHFNDCEFEVGCCRDRHAHYTGGGKMGFEKMMKLAEFCVNNGIAMVTE